MDQKTKIKSALSIMKIVADTIQEVQQIPAGTLYAAMMQHNISLRGYNQIIDTLRNCGLIEIKNNLITWKGYPV